MYLHLVKELKEKTVGHENHDYTNCNCNSRYSPLWIDARTIGLGNNQKNEHPNYYITEIGQNNEKSPEDLRKIAVSQSPVRRHWLTLMWKALNEKYNNLSWKTRPSTDL